ncbi:MAG TPA: alpha/beta hydrolase [Actinomycetota bacterium]|nr:alpha/beta hydrolase [Actinomycetota bacterium]
MKRGHRFMAASIGAVAAVAAAGRAASLRGRRDDGEEELLGSVRGEPLTLRGPRASRIYAERLAGTRGTVVLTHGWCLTESVWHYQKRALADAGFTVVAWDLPGHGASTPVARGHLTLDLAVDALARVVEHVADPAGMILVGHSLGGVLTLRYLTSGGCEPPDSVRGVVFASTPMMHFARSVAGSWPGAGLEARALGAAMEFIVANPALDRIFQAGVGGNAYPLSYRVVRVGFGRRPVPAQVRFVRDVIATVPPHVRVDTYKAMTGYDLSDDVRSVKLPALVVIGERDRLINPTESREMAARLPRARVVAFPRAGHASFLEEHERFDRELIAFCERRLAAPPKLAAPAKGAPSGGSGGNEEGRLRRLRRAPRPPGGRRPSRAPRSTRA